MTAFAHVGFRAHIDAVGNVVSIVAAGKEPDTDSENLSGRGISLAITVNSVNSRFLDLNLNLPKELRGLSEKLSQFVRSKVRRGKVDVVIEISSSDPGSSEARAIEDILLGHLRKLRWIYRQRASVPLGSIDPVALLEMARNDLARRSKTSSSPANWNWDDLSHCLEQAIDELNRCRQAEGTAILEHLRKSCGNCQALLNKLAEQRNISSESTRARLLKQVEGLTVEHTPNRLEEELLYLLKRHDVEEEHNRLSAHLLALEQILHPDDAAENEPDTDEHSPGKRINFLIQEMGREANTIGSKSADHPTAMLSNEFKLELERMREQVANLE